MEKGNISGALKLLTNNMTNGILPLYEKTLNFLKRSQPAYEETVINGEPPVIHCIIYDDINEELVRKRAIRTKSGSGPSGLDTDGGKIVNIESFRQLHIRSL